MAVTFLPLVGALALMLVPRRLDAVLRGGALAVGVATFALSLSLYAHFDVSSADYQFEEMARWIPTLGVSYHLGIDGISLLLVLLTTFITPLALASAWRAIEERSKEFVLTLRVKGLGIAALVRHVLKNASPQILTVMGLQFGFALGGSVLVETVFSWPGTGYLLNIAIFQRDMPLLQGIVLVLSTTFVMLNLAVDVVRRHGGVVSGAGIGADCLADPGHVQDRCAADKPVRQRVRRHPRRCRAGAQIRELVAMRAMRDEVDTRGRKRIGDDATGVDPFGAPHVDEHAPERVVADARDVTYTPRFTDQSRGGNRHVRRVAAEPAQVLLRCVGSSLVEFDHRFAKRDDPRQAFVSSGHCGHRWKRTADIGSSTGDDSRPPV